MRQPEVEGELRRFGEGPDQDQDQRRQVVGRGLDDVLVLQDHRQVVAARDLAQDQHASDHCQPAAACNGKRHPRALAAFGQVLPVADQQEGGERGQFPEDQKEEDVVTENDPDHRALKEQKVGEELTHRVGLREVEAGVEDDQQTDPQDQAGEHQAQAVEEEVGVQAKRGQPFDPGLHHLAAQDSGGLQGQKDESEKRHRSRGGGAGIASRTDHQAGKERTKEGKRRDQG